MFDFEKEIKEIIEKQNELNSAFAKSIIRIDDTIRKLLKEILFLSESVKAIASTYEKE